MLKINRCLFAHALFQYGLKAGNVFLEGKKEEKQNPEDVHKPRTLGHPSPLFTKALAH